MVPRYLIRDSKQLLCLKQFTICKLLSKPWLFFKMLLDSVILSPRHSCPSQTPSNEMIMWCNEVVAGKGVEFGNSHTKILLPSVDFFGLCHGANSDVVEYTFLCASENFRLKSLRPGDRNCWLINTSSILAQAGCDRKTFRHPRALL